MCTAKIFVAGSLDHEAFSSHSIVVRTTDQHGLFHVQKFSITVVDVNDAPTVSDKKMFDKFHQPSISALARPNWLKQLIGWSSAGCSYFIQHDNSLQVHAYLPSAYCELIKSKLMGNNLIRFLKVFPKQPCFSRFASLGDLELQMCGLGRAYSTLAQTLSFKTLAS